MSPTKAEIGGLTFACPPFHHATRVVGFWRSRRNVGPGLVEVRLMAWYKDLGAWEGSRFWAGSADPAAAAAHARFRERAGLTIDTAVTVMWRAE